ncbi:DUF2808 domain-containing protein [Brunnivagina elsteri]|uniref:DUF2808 domain-containing protein n=1 Tax=Brunnivagina elsteri CCALA 953 TaxID=987040 RepID=A0A2A2TGG2_9CYAN|nr:DUF2808 domain-containing protein [Calothrix elsteri]PAX52834.1 hypothetical protein CK510_17130 [Calothrix elsteri CCALA 953]
MKKLLIDIINICAITTMLIIPSGYVRANDDNGKLPHVDSNSQFPQTKWSNVRQSLQVHIPKNSQIVSQISIVIPETVSWSNKISDVVVTGNKIEKANTNISINEKIIVISFKQALPPNSKLEIDIKNVKQPFLGNGPIYRLFTKFIGSNVEIPIGLARFRVI